MRTDWPLPAPGDIVWCRFPELPTRSPGPKPRPALVLEVIERDDGAEILVVYGTSQRVSRMSAGEFAITRLGHAAAYKAAAAQGVKLVFMENTPSGLVAGRDYVSAVSADNYGNGAASAKLLAEAMDGEGEIGLITHAADFFVTRQRYEAVKKTFADDYPGIRIVAQQAVSGPDFAAEAEKLATKMLVTHSKLKGIWAVWDVPAEGVIAAARKSGRRDLAVTTIDLGKVVAADMARNGVIKGLAAQRVYDQGVTEALLAGYGLLGKPAPAFVALPALPVTRANLSDAWQIVYRQPLPSDLNLQQ